MRLFIVSYDISDDDRRADVARILESFGRRVQYSVFECVLGDMGRARLRVKLDHAIHHGDDQVLFFYMGPLEGRAIEAVDYLGKPYEPPDTSSIVR